MQQTAVAGDPTKALERVNGTGKDPERIQSNRKGETISDNSAQSLFN